MGWRGKASGTGRVAGLPWLAPSQSRPWLLPREEAGGRGTPAACGQRPCALPARAIGVAQGSCGGDCALRARCPSSAPVGCGLWRLRQPCQPREASSESLTSVTSQKPHPPSPAPGEDKMLARSQSGCLVGGGCSMGCVGLWGHSPVSPPLPVSGLGFLRQPQAHPLASAPPRTDKYLS